MVACIGSSLISRTFVLQSHPSAMVLSIIDSVHLLFYMTFGGGVIVLGWIWIGLSGLCFFCCRVAMACVVSLGGVLNGTVSALTGCGDYGNRSLDSVAHLM
jgi:hypothetical protein